MVTVAYQIRVITLDGLLVSTTYADDYLQSLDLLTSTTIELGECGQVIDHDDNVVAEQLGVEQ